MEFQPDYIIAWNFNDSANPILNISRLRAEDKSMTLAIESIDAFHSDVGICSLRQIVAEYEQRLKEGTHEP